MHCIQVPLGVRTYDIHVGNHCLRDFTVWLFNHLPGRSCCIISDHNLEQIGHVKPLLEELQQLNYRVECIVLPPGEGQKSSSTLQLLYDRLAEMRADRQTLVIALGGGVVGDVAGFAAATFNRGLPLIMLPTTLLAMVDSSVGGKTGINHPRGKNLIGAFYQPQGVWIDTAYLQTLPELEYRSGLAEVVKYGVILDAGFFEWMEKHSEKIQQRETQALEYIIARSCALKADVVSRDEWEMTGLRAILNYGHTFAHAFEQVAGYGVLLHGQAVSMGMMCASILAERLGRIDGELTDRQSRLLYTFSLPTGPNPSWDPSAVVEAMRSDKKNVAGSLRLVLPVRLGQVESGVAVPENQVLTALVDCQQREGKK